MRTVFDVRGESRMSSVARNFEDMPAATQQAVNIEAPTRDHRSDPGADLDIVSRQNNSLGARRLWAVFGVLALFSLTLACAFAMAGAWMVLPYSILELALVGLAFHVVERRAGDWERLMVVGDRVIVERQVGRSRTRHECNLCWLRVECEDLAADDKAGGVVRGFGVERALTLSFAGESWRFGDALMMDERVTIARKLRRLVAARR